MEIEAKYRVRDRAIFADLLRQSALERFTLTPAPAPERQRTTYFDTPDRRLAATRHNLRIREIDGRRIATVKRSLRTTEHLHERDEWEAAIAAGSHPGAWPPSEARRRALEIVGRSPIEPLFTVYNRRQRVIVSAAAPVAEISLDEGSISAAGRVVGFRELEVELIGAARDAFEALLAALEARYPLIPEPRSKKARGMELLSRALAKGALAERSVGG